MRTVWIAEYMWRKYGTILMYKRKYDTVYWNMYDVNVNYNDESKIAHANIHKWIHDSIAMMVEIGIHLVRYTSLI